jgi:hypothetical protein
MGWADLFHAFGVKILAIGPFERPPCETAA